ncbi:MAG: hypothetical protein K8R92_09700 [Planctomycetes bacterium]|nr:hypothetical protein [Planctomycetota bacterium]
MIKVSTHLFGSTDGYQTLNKSDDVSEAEERALSIFGFGAPKSQEEIDRLVQVPSVAGRLLPGGRFALTRLFPGEPDVAGRDTVERRSILFSALDWREAVRGDLESLLSDENAFERGAFLKKEPHWVSLGESEDLLPQAGELERRLYDILLATPHQNACALVPDEPANRRALLRLLKLLPQREASLLSWGLGLFAATPGVRLATASESVAAAPNVRWPLLTGSLGFPEKVAALGLDEDERVAALNVIAEPTEVRWHLMLAARVLKSLQWIVLALVLILLTILYLIVRARNQPAGAPPPQAPVQAADATPAIAVPPAAAPPAAPEIPPIAPITTANNSPVIGPSVGAPPAAAGNPPATVTPENPPSAPATTTPSPAPTTPEPANIAQAERELWSKARTELSSVQLSPFTEMSKPQAWLKQSMDQADRLAAIQQQVSSETKHLKSTFKLTNWIDLKSKPSQRLVDVAAAHRSDTESYFRASVLLLAESDLLVARLFIEAQLNLLKDPKRKLSADDTRAIAKLESKLQELSRPEAMTGWMQTLPVGISNESIRQSLYSQLLELSNDQKYNIEFPPPPLGVNPSARIP